MGEMEEPTSEVVLRFAVIGRGAGVAEEFPLEMTLATVLADMEKQREKAGLLRKREETLEFASMLYWPIVVVPWRDDRHLVFDGMGVWSYVISQGRIPDPDPFTAAADAAKDHTTLLALLTALPGAREVGGRTDARGRDHDVQGRRGPRARAGLPGGGAEPRAGAALPDP